MEYDQKATKLSIVLSDAESIREDVEHIRKSQNELVNQKVEQIYTEKEKSLKSAYKAKENALHGAFFGTLAYAILTTIFTAFHSERFISDFKTFFITLWYLISKLWETALKWANTASGWGDKIPQEVVAFIAHYLLLALVILLVFGGVLVLVSFAGYKAGKFYVPKLIDNISFAVVLVSLSVAVYFAEPIRAVVPINLLLMVLIVHVVYVIIRIKITQNRGYY